MLDWTGERFVPWAREPAVAYEHLHRYIWASSLARDKKVLDLASGEGYGTKILARQAAFVCGVDLDGATVRHASQRYARPNLQFLQGSVTQVPIPDGAAFDLIVCFEAIEHVREQEELMREVKRLLKPGGIFIVSTPNKAVYREEESPNPFHVRELSFDEFNGLLTRHFSSVRYFGQRVHPGSSLWPVGTADGSAVREYSIEHVNDEFQIVAPEQHIAMYFVALASDSALPPCEGSVLLDRSDELMRVTDRQLAVLTAALEERDAAVRALKETVAAQQEALGQNAEHAKALDAMLTSKQEELETIYKSRGWKLLVKLRALKQKLL